MKDYQTFVTKDSKNPSSQAIHTPKYHSFISFSSNSIANNIHASQEQRASISSLEDVIIHDPGYNGSISSSVLTICNTIFGSGMLTIPYAMATIGLVNGIFAIIIFGLTSFFSLFLLIKCSKMMGGRNVSFFSVSSRTYPRLSVIFDLAVAIKCFGVSISYLVIIGELLPKVTLGLFPNLAKDSIFLTGIFWISLCMLIVVPLAFQKSLSSLKYASTLSLIAVNYIVLLVVYFCIKQSKPIQKIDDGLNNNNNITSSSYLSLNNDGSTSQKISYFKWSMDFFRVLPIFVFSYTCHQNIFTVFNEMKITSRHSDNRHTKSLIATCISIAITMFVYITIGVTGYLTFGDSTKSNIISMYPSSDKLVLLGQSLMALMVCTCYAVQCHPARKSFGNVINYIRTIKRRSGYEPLIDAEDIIGNSENDENDLQNNNDDFKEKQPLLFKIKSQPSLITEPLLIKSKKPQSSYNHTSSSLSVSEASTSNSILQPISKDHTNKVGLSKSYNDLYNMKNDNNDYCYHSVNILPQTNVNTNSIQTQSFELSNTLHNGITTVLLLLSYTIACSVKDLGTVLSVVGATGSTTICYILPGLLYYKLKKNERGNQKSTLLMKISLILSVAGVILMCNSLFFIFFKI